MKEKILEGVSAPILIEDEFYALPYSVYDGAIQFYERGYDYDDPDFWDSYEDVDPQFIQAVRSYDKLQSR